MTCGTNAWVYQDADAPQYFKIVSDTCRDRWCLPCGQARARNIAANIWPRLVKDRFRFITLTLRSTDQTLPDLLQQLSTSFAALRRVNPWRKTQTGGVAFTEIKYHDRPIRWNVHLHVLSEGLYMRKHELSAAWKKITGGSFIVDLKLVKRASEVVQYVTKYVSKPLDPTVLYEPSALVTAIEALHGRRMVTTFGNWRGLELAKHNDDRTWVAYAPLLTVHENARDPEHIDWHVWRLLCHDEAPDDYPRPPPPPRFDGVTICERTKRRQATFDDWLKRDSTEFAHV